MGRRSARPKAEITLAGACGTGSPLWAPWRSAYITRARRGQESCIFCVSHLSAAARRRRFILCADKICLVMLNRYPYNAGHLLVAPRRHVASPEILGREERSALAEAVTGAVVRLRAALHPAGFNLGANLGQAAGAGFAGHLHWHIVPRFAGDANFMPAVAGIRVISQHLADTFRLLAPRFAGSDGPIS